MLFYLLLDILLIENIWPFSYHWKLFVFQTFFVANANIQPKIKCHYILFLSAGRSFYLYLLYCRWNKSLWSQNTVPAHRRSQPPGRTTPWPTAVWRGVSTVRTAAAVPRARVCPAPPTTSYQISSLRSSHQIRSSATAVPLRRYRSPPWTTPYPH